ncbi:HTH domain-containing protein [Pseudomonas pohangensis]|uniref:HTH domain-containing protein n=1 Tax=Pseudomonas pohangensis TaxID=364197 RepID=A0A1H2DVB9_9PSED|nr:HTH domain-containing protein [Pseudomonas pohangensis]SDT86779.1 HTH domain-containing protein [Pseudomonas pohangensis]
MERSQRINRINALLQRPQGVSMAQLQEDLEVSRQTINRDIQLMRDQMHAPIVWSRYDHCYRLENGGHVGPTYTLPGLWFSPAQAYAFLTLNNMVEKIAPNLLGPFLNPMRATLKRMLHEADFGLFGLDQKIQIDMPAMPEIGDLDFSNLVDGLLKEQSVRLDFKRADGIQKSLRGKPVKLHISPEGWLLDLQVDGGENLQQIDVAHVIKVAAESEQD